jgi:hypothetical protein
MMRLLDDLGPAAILFLIYFLVAIPLAVLRRRGTGPEPDPTKRRQHYQRVIVQVRALRPEEAHVRHGVLRAAPHGTLSVACRVDRDAAYAAEGGLLMAGAMVPLGTIAR